MPSVVLEVSIGQDEWPGLVADNGGHFSLPSPGGNHAQAVHLLNEAFQPECRLRITQNSRGRSGELVDYKGNGTVEQFDLRRPN